MGMHGVHGHEEEGEGNDGDASQYVAVNGLVLILLGQGDVLFMAAKLVLLSVLPLFEHLAAARAASPSAVGGPRKPPIRMKARELEGGTCKL